MREFNMGARSTMMVVFDWYDVQAIANEQGLSLSDEQCREKFDALRWGLKEALTEAGNLAIADNLEALGCEATTGAKRL